MCFATVYEGVKSFYKESDETKPVNVYGETKVAAEKYIQSNYNHFSILRSSIIYGPQPFVPLPKTLPVQVTMSPFLSLIPRISFSLMAIVSTDILVKNERLNVHVWKLFN